MSGWKNRITGHGTKPARDFQLNPRNWRTHPQRQKATLVAALEKVGWVAGVIENVTTGNLIDGHERVEEALARDEEVPYLQVELTVEEETFVLATLDTISHMAKADEDKLTALLEEIRAGDATLSAMVEELAFEMGVLLDPMNPTGDPGPQIDRAEELRDKWSAERGQLWKIPSRTVIGGTHRLLCGDSTNLDDVTRLMDGKRACLFATDPPYLVDYDGTNHPHKWNERDKNKDWNDSYHDWDNAEQGEALYDGFIACALQAAITENAAWYCWHASRNQSMLEQVWERHGAFVHQQIIWAKDRPVLTRSWYMWQHEPCFFGWVKGKKPQRVASDYPGTIWSFPTIAPRTTTDHPTSKPVELFTIPMQQHTRHGDICYEPFAGSGSQFVAGEQMGRLVYGIELQPEFVAVILERLAGMGLEPQLLHIQEAA